MGVTIRSKNFSEDVGYGGFNLFREAVAMLTDERLGKHYNNLRNGMFLPECEASLFFKDYDAKTGKLIEEGVTTSAIANFLYQSDTDGRIDQNQAKQIYEKIKDYDDDICYGYVGRPDRAMFSDLKNIFKDCAENGGEVEWS